MTRPTRFALVLALLLPAAFFSACSGGDDGSDQPPADTWTLSGLVRLGGAGCGGVTVTLDDLTGTAADRTSVTSPAGAFSFTGVPDGDYLVTPSLASRAFSPASRSLTIAGADLAAGAFDTVLWPLSGTVLFGGSGWANGGTVSVTGEMSASTRLDGAGAYSLPLPDGSYTLAALVTGQSTAPASTAVTIAGAASPAHDFSLLTHTISGAVTQLYGTPAEGAAVNLAGKATGSATTAADGSYSFPGLLNGSYTLSATVVAGQSTTPASITRLLYDADSAGNDFALRTYTLRGRVTTNGNPLRKVGVLLGGDSVDSALTDASGNFTFTDLLNGNYTVAPDLSAQAVSPAGPLAVPVSYASVRSCDFTVPRFLWFVDKGTVAGSRLGYSWDTALAHPQNALGSARSGDQVWLREGSYISQFNGNPHPAVVTMKAGVAVYGGFAGTEIALAERDLSAHHTTLDGRNNTRHVVVGADNALLSGFNISGGFYTAGSVGAGLWVRNAAMTVEACLFAGNVAKPGYANTEYGVLAASKAAGGAIAYDRGALTVRGSVFTGNRVAEERPGTSLRAHGGAVAALDAGNAGVLRIYDCLFLGNQAASSGAVEVDGAPANIHGSAFFQNQALYGGDAVSVATTATLGNCTLLDHPNGALYLDSFAQATVRNSIMWDGTFEGDTTGLDVGYSDVEMAYAGSVWAGTGNINGDPVFLDEVNGDLRLGGTSPCIDAGYDAAVDGSLTTDLDGNPRIQGTVDMGAYEQ